MALTRFKDARADKDGPVSGAIIVIPVQFDDVANGETVHFSWAPPTGMSVEIVDINVHASALTTTVTATVGTVKAGTQVVAGVVLTTNLGSVTLKETSITSDDVLDVRLVAAAGGDAESVSATMTVYVSDPPTSLLIRGDQGHM